MVGRVLDDVVVAVHYLVMAWIVFGGYLVWRWRKLLPFHIVMVAWAVFSLIVPITCPLTWLENYFRHMGGLPPLKDGFVATYITGVLYPANDLLIAQIVAGVIVLVSWVGIVMRSSRRQRPTTDQHATLS